MGLGPALAAQAKARCSEKGRLVLSEPRMMVLTCSQSGLLRGSHSASWAPQSLHKPGGRRARDQGAWRSHGPAVTQAWKVDTGM